jgi:hypothetical protein
MNPATAQDIKAIREELGVGMYEAKRIWNQRQALAALRSRTWFLHIRTVLRYLVQASV